MDSLTLTVRVIQNFQAGIVRYIVVKEVSPGDSFARLAELATAVIQEDPRWARLRPMIDKFDTFKLYSVPGSFKSSNRTINLEDDEHLIVASDNHGDRLSDHGIVNEAEISWFCASEYAAYRRRGEIKVDGFTVDGRA